MSRKNKTLRAFLHNTPNATLQDAWDAAWKAQGSKAYSLRIHELEAENAALKADIADWFLYSESVAEVCTEEVFAEIEAEFNLRQSVAMKEPEHE